MTLTGGPKLIAAAGNNEASLGASLAAMETGKEVSLLGEITDERERTVSQALSIYEYPTLRD